jgi:hypothetical protein
MFKLSLATIPGSTTQENAVFNSLFYSSSHPCNMFQVQYVYVYLSVHFHLKMKKIGKDSNLGNFQKQIEDSILIQEHYFIL